MKKDLVEKLKKNRDLRNEEFLYLLNNQNDFKDKLFKEARNTADKYFGNKLYVRGLIEISNICKNNCLYCGIRKSNQNVKRYRLNESDILSAVKSGTELGFKTFVLQGGEDPYYTDDLLVNILTKVKKIAPDCAITLSIGERDYVSYKRLKNAGADRFLLRHEASSEELYYKLHPSEMSLENRKKCLYNLKELKYQTGSGFMVGAPYQTYENIVEDLKFLRQLNPEMIGIGPFISQHDTVFSDMQNGSVDLTVFLIAILRLMFPCANIPATTALATLSSNGRIEGIKAGANVFMPNLSPDFAKKNYNLYDNKLYSNMESAKHLQDLKDKFKNLGFEIVMERGDFVARKFD